MTRAKASNLVSLRRWRAATRTDGEGIAYFADRRRRLSTMVGGPLVLLVSLAIWGAGRPAVAGLVLAAAGVVSLWLGQSGGSGYYRIDENDQPTEFLGRAKPEQLADMVPLKRNPRRQ